jgi:hypothetical protein
LKIRLPRFDWADKELFVHELIRANLPVDMLDLLRKTVKLTKEAMNHANHDKASQHQNEKARPQRREAGRE